MTTHRPSDTLPSALVNTVEAIAEKRWNTMTELWRRVLSQAEADILDALDGGIVYPLPSPDGWWTDLPTSALTVARWRQREAEAKHQAALFEAAASSRAAILIAGAVTYIQADGDLSALLRQRPVGWSWSTALPANLTLIGASV